MLEYDIITMYNTKYVCQYNSPDVFLETDDINEETKDQIRNILYRNDLLYIFDMDDFDEHIIGEAINELYEKIKINNKFFTLMQLVSNKIIGSQSNAGIGLLFLYSFDYLYITHVCVSEFLETGEISATNIANLYNLVG